MIMEVQDTITTFTLTRPFTFSRPKGKLIAFVGTDGSGKSLLTRKLCNTLSRHLPVTFAYLGLGSGDLGRRIGQLPLLGKVIEAKLNNKAKRIRTKGEKIPGNITAIAVYALSLKRYFNHLRVKRALNAGVTVVTDRYPQVEIPGSCDGPGLSAASPGNRFVAWLARSESKMYKKMASYHPDLIIRLDVSPAIAFARKPDHDLQLLESKYEVMKTLKFDGAPMILVDATQPFESVWHKVACCVEPLLVINLIGQKAEYLHF